MANAKKQEKLSVKQKLHASVRELKTMTTARIQAIIAAVVKEENARKTVFLVSLTIKTLQQKCVPVMANVTARVTPTDKPAKY